MTNVEQQTTPTTITEPTRKARSGTVLLSLFIATSAVVFWYQRQQINLANRALNRYPWATRATDIPDGHFRLLIQDLVIGEQSIVKRVRIETNDDCTIMITSGDSSSRILSRRRHKDEHAWAEVTIVAHVTSHTDTHDVITILSQTKTGNGSVGGPSQWLKPKGISLTEFFKMLAKPGVYNLEESHSLFRVENQEHKLTIQ